MNVLGGGGCTAWIVARYCGINWTKWWLRDYSLCQNSLSCVCGPAWVLIDFLAEPLAPLFLSLVPLECRITSFSSALSTRIMGTQGEDQFRIRIIIELDGDVLRNSFRDVQWPWAERVSINSRRLLILSLSFPLVRCATGFRFLVATGELLQWLKWKELNCLVID